MTIPADKQPDEEANNKLPPVIFEEEETNGAPRPSAPPEADFGSEREFPLPFYDPTTSMVMINPVVNASGDSLEKPDKLTEEESKAYYANRALQNIIMRETQRSSNSLIGSLRRLDDSARKGWNQMLDKSAIGTEYRPLPDSFYCIITSELMRDPVITPSGNSFDREAIVNWIRANNTDPVTRQPLAVSELRRNNNLYSLIQEEKNRPNLEGQHPSIRRWIASEQETSRPVLLAEDLADSSTTATTPVNYAQISEARRRRSQQERSFTILFLFTLLVIVLFVPSNATFAVLFLALFVLQCCRSAALAREQQQQREALRLRR